MNNTPSTMTIAVDLDTLLQTIYAESAWRKAMHLSKNADSPMLTPDRRRLLMPFIDQAFGWLCAAIGTFARQSNLSTWQQEGLLSIDVAYKGTLSNTSQQSLGSHALQALAARVLSICYATDEQYAKRSARHLQSITTTLTISSQL